MAWVKRAVEIPTIHATGHDLNVVIWTTGMWNAEQFDVMLLCKYSSSVPVKMKFIFAVTQPLI